MITIVIHDEPNICFAAGIALHLQIFAIKYKIGPVFQNEANDHMLLSSTKLY